MLNFKDINAKYIGGLILLGVIMLLIVAIFVHIVGPILHLLLPMVFTSTTLSVTEALLLLILISLHK